MGTPKFAVSSLAKVHAEHEVVAVITQPDRRRGRGQKFSFSQVKKWALKNNLNVLQPNKIGEESFMDDLEKLAADIFVVVAYGQKIPHRLLAMPPLECINVHASLLPQYRGAAPINAAIINGDTFSGVTTMYLSSQWDAGDIILQAQEYIKPRDTAGALHDRLMEKGAKLLGETLRQIKRGKAPRIPQDHKAATYATKLSKQDGCLDFKNSNKTLDRLIRGMNPWPVAYAVMASEEIKIWQAEPREKSGTPGEILALEKDSLIVGCKKGSLALQKVQRPNSRIITGLDLANGLRLAVGDNVISR